LGSTATFSQEALRRLMSCEWPGNVRQLENTIERAVALSGGRGQMDVVDLPAELQRAGAPPIAASLSLPDDGLDLVGLIANIERDLIERSLERTNGNKGQAAKLLNLKRTTLVEKLKRLQK
jgi:DNA-binding NtrC family response regulator